MKYAVTHWPSLYGTRKVFRHKLTAWIYTKLTSSRYLFGAEMEAIDDQHERDWTKIGVRISIKFPARFVDPERECPNS